MSEPPTAAPIATGLKGASVGGIIGITVWQVLAWNFLSIGFVTGLVLLTVYMGLCMLLGVAIERFLYRT